MKIQIKNINGEPIGREVNPNEKYQTNIVGDSTWKTTGEWKDFERIVTYHPAPGCEESDGVEGELVWQYLTSDTPEDWKPEDGDPRKWVNWEYSEIHFIKDFEQLCIYYHDSVNRQIWIVPSQKVELKEVIRKVQIVPLTGGKLAEVTYPSNVTVKDIKIIKKAIEMIELASPPTH